MLCLLWEEREGGFLGGELGFVSGGGDIGFEFRGSSGLG